MAEAITEMIIPGTYIEVRAEGLIGVSGIATGNVGLVGTASRGPVDTAVIVSSFAEAQERFGAYDAWTGGTGDELTLVRAAQIAFANGASTVYAVRCAAASALKATLPLNDSAGLVVTLEATTPGTWGNDIVAQVEAASENGHVAENRQVAGSGGTVAALHANIADSPRNAVRVAKPGGATSRLALVTSGAAAKGKAVVKKTDGTLTFHADDQPAAGDVVVASYEVDKAACREVTVRYEIARERYTVVDADDLRRKLAASSGLVTAAVPSGAGGKVPDVMAQPLPLGAGANGEDAQPTDYTRALAKLEAEPVNILALAGLGFTDAQAALLAHVEGTENAGRERIAVVGADSDDPTAVIANADAVSDKRAVLVAPGIVAQDLASGRPAALPPAYAAAAVAGVIASLAVQVSPTNKTLRVSGLTRDYTDGELKKLLQNRVMPLEKKAGYRVVQGLTTDGGPFRQVSVRRIVDYAKAGTRIGSLPYIGRLNNARVRGALHATLNGFLSDMVLNEALTEFSLTVTATREQEIAGVALVTMMLKPTFSIDYVKVIMNLS